MSSFSVNTDLMNESDQAVRSRMFATCPSLFLLDSSSAGDFALKVPITSTTRRRRRRSFNSRSHSLQPNHIVIPPIKKQSRNKKKQRANSQPELYRGVCESISSTNDEKLELDSQTLIGNRKTRDRVKKWMKRRLCSKCALLFGPPGSGKSFSVRKLAMMMNLNLQVCDAMSATQKDLRAFVQSSQLVSLEGPAVFLIENLPSEHGSMIEDESGPYKHPALIVEEEIKRMKRFQPLFCITDSKSHRAIRQLAQVSSEFRFFRLFSSDMRKIMNECIRLSSVFSSYFASISFRNREQLQSQMIEQACGDPRMMQNLLWWHTLIPFSPAAHVSSARKQLNISIFDKTRMLFTDSMKGKRKPIDTNEILTDVDVLELMVQENYLSKINSIDSMADMASSLSDLDVLNTEYEIPSVPATYLHQLMCTKSFEQSNTNIKFTQFFIERRKQLSHVAEWVEDHPWYDNTTNKS